MGRSYDAVIMIGYGGPEKPEDILPFLRNATKGRGIPEERLKEVARHYEKIGGRSPINELTFKQARGLERELEEMGHKLPVYVGMRNWRPLLADTVKRMAEDGVRSAVGIILSAYQSPASWEQYMENFGDALAESGVEMDVAYTPPVFDHPLFIESLAENVSACLDHIPEAERAGAKLIFTAHSIPVVMADRAPYVQQLETASGLVAGRVGRGDDWMLCYQSRSGRPQDPWLEPDICDVVRDLARRGVKYVIVEPIGFICDHVEVLFDIGVEAKEAAEEAGVELLRAETVNDHRKFLRALADLVDATINDSE